ncbi:ImcF-related family protein [Rhizobium beringeri]
MLDPAEAARRRYGQAVDALAASPLAEALGVALATEGEATALYDSLRAWSILSGTSDWQPWFLAGWIDDRAQTFPELTGLAVHVAAMSAGPADLQKPDSKQSPRRDSLLQRALRPSVPCSSFPVPRNPRPCLPGLSGRRPLVSTRF